MLQSTPVAPTGYVFKQKYKYKNCTNGTSLVLYEPRTANDSQRAQSMAIDYDEIYSNGTRSRYFVNGTVGYYLFDQTFSTYVRQPPSIFSKWTTVVRSDVLFRTYFEKSANYDDWQLYRMIKMFDNGTTFWYREMPDVNDILLPTASEAETLAKHVTWYETQGKNYMLRVNYYWNGTVA